MTFNIGSQSGGVINNSAATSTSPAVSRAR